MSDTDTTTTELAFSMKPRRMTNPPQNQGKWLPGYDGVEVRIETDPARIAYFSREATWGDLFAEPTEEDMSDTLQEVATGKVLGAAFKGGLGFRIRASRSSMDQMLRLAEGSGGAGSGAGAQTTRDNDQRDFNIIVPNTIEELKGVKELNSDLFAEGRRDPLYRKVVDLIDRQRKVYGELVDAGVPPQDARYVALPLGFQTQWMHIMSLGNMIKMCEQRLCNGLTQHETNYLVRVMRDLVVVKYPWMDKNLRSGCEKRGECVSSTMLFPPCGAFMKPDFIDSDDYAMGLNSRSDEEVRLKVTKYDPDKHLYPAEANDAMQFALWDAERVKLERRHPHLIFSMASEPTPIFNTEIGFAIT